MSDLLTHLQDLKQFRDKQDSPEYRALVWNMVGADLDELIALAAPVSSIVAHEKLLDQYDEALLDTHNDQLSRAGAREAEKHFIEVRKAMLIALGIAAPESARAPLPPIEKVSAAVHAAWIASKLAQDVTSRKAEDGEELMVPYSELSEKAKELDRATVRAVYAAISDG